MSEDNSKSTARRDFLRAAGVAAGAALASPAFAVRADAPETPVPDVAAQAPDVAATDTVSVADVAPVLGYQFQLKFGNALFATFSEVTGIGSESAVTEMRPGNGGPTTSLPGRNKWLSITLKRGFLPAQDKTALDLWDWRQLVLTGKVGTYRKSGSIVMLKIEGSDAPIAIAQWNFTNGWPSRIEAPFPAADSPTTATEEVVIVHDGIVRVAVPSRPT